MSSSGRYQEGQRWSFKNTLNEFENTFVIGEVDTFQDPQSYTIYVRHDRSTPSWRPPDVDGVILSLPHEGLDQCVVDLIETGVVLPDWWEFGKEVDPQNPPGGITCLSCKRIDVGLRQILQLEMQDERGRRLRAKAVPIDEVIRQLQPWKVKQKRATWRPIVEALDGNMTASKFCGTPWLADNEPWPNCPDCARPLHLFLQLNLSELPNNLDGRFGTGLLQLFYCWYTESPEDDYCECNAFRSFDGGKFVRIVDATHRGSIRELPRSARFLPAKTIVGWSHFHDFPDTNEHAHLGLSHTYGFQVNTVRIQCPELGLDYENQDGDIAERISSAVRGDKLGGWPRWIQGMEYPNCIACNRRMRFVFQLDSEDNLPFMFGDNGCGHITQCPVHKDVVAFAWNGS